MIELSPEEREALRQEHLQGGHRREFYEDCALCHLERNIEAGLIPEGGQT